MRPRLISAGAAVAAAMVLAGPGVSGRAQIDDGSIAAGAASASSVFITVSDERNFYEGATTPPIDVFFGYSSGNIDRSGTSSAVAAAGYSPYVDLPPAVNALAPGPDVDYEPILSRVRASITGQPPKDAKASLTTPTEQAEAGTMEAHLAAGPVLEAFSTLFRVEPAPATHIKSAVSRIKVAKVAGVSVTEASTVLRSVSIAGLLTFDSIAMRASSGADGGAGNADGDVTVEGAAIAGIPIGLTENGIQAADRAIPLDLTKVEDRLKDAGIELIGPSTVALDPGGERSLAIATGPQITFTSSRGERVQLVLGRAIAASTLLAGFVPGVIPPAAPSAPAPLAPPATVDGGPVFTPPSDGVVPQQPAVPGQAVVDLGPLVLSDAKSVDAFAALYGALAVGGILILTGLVVPRRRSLLDQRLG